MYGYEKEILEQIVKKLRKRYSYRIVTAYVFGSRVRGDHDAGSDFDVLIVVRDKEPGLESAIIGVIVDEEMKSGLSFTPVVKDQRAFEMEKKHHTPFYENLIAEGVLI